MVRLALLMLGAVVAQVPTFRSTSDVVPLFVTVKDASGRLVTDLDRDAFEILDNGKVQPITLFDNSPQPIRLIAMLDLSGSMADNLPLLKRASTALIEQLASTDLARVGTFGERIAISPAFSRDPAVVTTLLPTTIRATAPTPLWRAVDYAMNEFRGVAAGRRVVLVLSDGKDSGALAGEQTVTSLSVSDRARRDDIMVYGVGLRSAPGPVAPGGVRPLSAVLGPTAPDPALAALAHDTGGGYFELTVRDDLAKAFGRVIDELHRQYLIGFSPSVRDGALHKVEVRVRNAALTAQARKTYLAPPKSQGFAH